MSWQKEEEEKALILRESGKTYFSIAFDLGRTESSVKHKIRRLQQKNNLDKYKNTNKKRAHFNKSMKLEKKEGLKILETHCGYGGMTDIYSMMGLVTCFDIDKDKINFIKKNVENVKAKRCDSETEILKLAYKKRVFDIVDIDPYGFPSRFFPLAFGLIEKGHLFLTIPIFGVSQINKIMTRHYEAFWNFDSRNKDDYLDCLKRKLVDWAFMTKREIHFVRIERFSRVYRFCIKVEKKSLLDIVGLEVRR